MAAINVIQGTNVSIDLSSEVVDNGWDIIGEYAVHYPCNPGYIIKNGVLPVGGTYVITYEISNFVSGIVRVEIGNTTGADRAANGVYTEVLISSGDGILRFYSDGFLRVKTLQYYQQGQQNKPAIMISFHEDDKHWGSDYSIFPDMMMKFLNKFICFKDGAVWEQNTNETRNNFFGVQYESEVQFYANIKPTTVKVFYSTRVQATTVWFCPLETDITILPTVGRSLGMQSRIKRNNFKNYQGSFYADFMRNMLDPRYNEATVALFKGEPLRGRFMLLRFVNDDITQSVLYEIDIKSAPSSFTY